MLLVLGAVAYGWVERQAERHTESSTRTVEGEVFILRSRDGSPTALLSNAKKFCASGDVIMVRASRKGDEIEIVVEDSGPGIPPQDLPHIFELFWSARHHPKKGAGLGLYICKGLVEVHGGRIWAESKPGEGSNFQFTLPMRA